MIHSHKHAILLTLPAPYRHTSDAGSVPSVDGWSRIEGVIGIVVAAAVALTAIAFRRKWRHERAAGNASD